MKRLCSPLGPAASGKAHCFEDQYASTGGQLYELSSGHDRFIADVRPLMENLLRQRGAPLGICCHPYDICTELIAREAGVIVTDVQGRMLDAPLNVEADVGWAGMQTKRFARDRAAHANRANAAGVDLKQRMDRIYRI
jgi:hypothetical protein